MRFYISRWDRRFRLSKTGQIVRFWKLESFKMNELVIEKPASLSFFWPATLCEAP
jgi:hypothetical protein